MKKEIGKFIVIEGPDGSGKTTLCQRLKEDLRQQDVDAVVVASYPDDAESLMLRKAWTDRSLQPATILAVVAELRYRVLTNTIIPALLAGKTVITDRWNETTLAYQAGGDGLESVFVEWMLAKTVDVEKSIADYRARENVELSEEDRIDLIRALVSYPLFYLDVSQEVCRARLEQRSGLLDAFEQKPDDYFERIRNAYDGILSEREGILTGMTHRIDASRSTELISVSIMGVLFRDS